VTETKGHLGHLEERQEVSGKAKRDLHQLKSKFDDGIGDFLDFSKELDDLITAKNNLARVHTLLQDYINIENELDDLKS